jgi:hypothetical protein
MCVKVAWACSHGSPAARWLFCSILLLWPSLRAESVAQQQWQNMRTCTGAYAGTWTWARAQHQCRHDLHAPPAIVCWAASQDACHHAMINVRCRMGWHHSAECCSRLGKSICIAKSARCLAAMQPPCFQRFLSRGSLVVQTRVEVSRAAYRVQLPRALGSPCLHACTAAASFQW